MNKNWKMVFHKVRCCMEIFQQIRHLLRLTVLLCVYNPFHKTSTLSIFLQDPQCFSTARSRYVIYKVKKSYMDPEKYTYLQTACHSRSNNLYCSNFTTDITMPCQEISKTDKTLLKKLRHYSLKCQLNQTGDSKYVVKALALKNLSIIEESSTKKMSIVTRCHCAWNEISPGVQQKPNTLKLSNPKTVIYFGFSVSVSLTTHATTISTRTLISKKQFPDRNDIYYKLDDMQPCNQYSVVVNISSNMCHNIHTIRKEIHINYNKVLHLDENSFTCEKKDVGAVILPVHAEIYRKHFYYFLKDKNQFEQNGSFDKNTIKSLSHSDIKIKVCKDTCICSNYISLTCLEKKTQTKLRIIILALSSCAVAILIVVVSCIKKATNFKRITDSMIQPIFGYNELEARSNTSTVAEPYYEEISDQLELTHPRGEERKRLDPAGSI